jgi:hypothetical protein
VQASIPSLDFQEIGASPQEYHPPGQGKSPSLHLAAKSCRFYGQFLVEFNCFGDPHCRGTICMATCSTFVMEYPGNSVIPTEHTVGFKLSFGASDKVSVYIQNDFKSRGSMTSQPLDEEGMLNQSARVHNLQRITCRRLGYGTRKDDIPPYRAVGPVTEEEYQSRRSGTTSSSRRSSASSPTANPSPRRSTSSGSTV